MNNYQGKEKLTEQIKHIILNEISSKHDLVYDGNIDYVDGYKDALTGIQLFIEEELENLIK